MKEKGKKVLVCPLDWGLGHATRCIPLVNALQDAGAEVLIGASGQPAELLRAEFPELTHIEFPGISIHYSPNGFSFVNALISLPRLLQSVRREHFFSEALIKKLNIDIIISDNRYGCWSRQCYSVFITHQLQIKLPSGLKFMEGMIKKSAGYYIKKFHRCFVPDTSDHLFAGELSVPFLKNSIVDFIGPLSRFNAKQLTSDNDGFEILVLLSGPEPQRTILENILREKLKDLSKSTLFVRGLPGDKNSIPDNLTFRFVNHLPSEVLNEHLLKSKFIICRSGYSSIMDLAATGRSALIIPTPGQTEQEYLAVFHHKQSHHVAQQQHQLNIEEAFNKLSLSQSIQMDSDVAKWVKLLLSNNDIQ
jgi:uncharacterized protein (TIGR00661 family)